MPVFRYRGYNQQGAATEGFIEADGVRDATLKVRTRGIFPKEITESGAPGKRRLFRPFSPLALAGITRRLSTLLTAGVPLIEAMGALSTEQKGDWKNVITDVKDRMAGGSTFARALRAHP
ncbi:MAG: type II secretion system F family protein, partial [Nitrospiraceae bacterium]